jgi:hypothetical protein
VTDEEKAIALGVLIVVAIVAVLFAIDRYSRKTRGVAEGYPLPPVQIAKIIDPGTIGEARVGGIALLIFTVICLFKYFSADTFNGQIVALLLWIGNGVFWGAFMIVAAVSSGRTSLVYRDQVPAERQEPRL